MAVHDTDNLTKGILAIGASPDAGQKLYRVVLEWALGLTRADEGGVLSVSPNQKSMRIEQFQGQGVNVKSRILPISAPPESICARAVLSKRIQNVPDVRDDPQFLAVSASSIRSLLAVPIVYENTVLGIVNLESTSTGYFTTAHATALGDALASITSWWHLLETVVRGYRYERVVDALERVSESHLADPPKPEKTLEVILGAALELTGSDDGGVCLLSLEKDALTVISARGLDPRLSGPPIIPKGRGFAWASILLRMSQNIPDVAQFPDVFVDLSGGHVRSLLCAPMFVGGDPVGVLNVESGELNHFSLIDEEVLTAFAQQAAIAVRTLQMREKFSAAEALAGLGSLSGNLTHRLNNTVGGIRVLSGMLAARAATAAPELRGIADDINTAATETLSVVEQYEHMFATDTKCLAVADVVTTVVSGMRIPPGIKLHASACDPSAIVTADERALMEIVRELVHNAVKSLGDSGNIWVTTRQTDFHVLLEVADDGERIPEEKASHVFEKGYSSRSRSTGTGFGLWWINTFLHKAGGEVRLCPNQPKGNKFQLFFPKTKL